MRVTLDVATSSCRAAAEKPLASTVATNIFNANSLSIVFQFRAFTCARV
jgi:hypothetical protein